MGTTGLVLNIDIRLRLDMIGILGLLVPWWSIPTRRWRRGTFPRTCTHTSETEQSHAPRCKTLSTGQAFQETHRGRHTAACDSNTHFYQGNKHCWIHPIRPVVRVRVKMGLVHDRKCRGDASPVK